MKLYKIVSTHLAPKDSHRAIAEYLVANNDQEVFTYLTKGEGNEYTSWSDKLDLEWWEEDYGSDAKELMENWLEQTQEERGEEWNEDLYVDLYYGRTIYSWEETDCTDETCMLLMVKNGLASLYMEG